MKAVLLVVPLLLIRFSLLSILNKESLKRAAFFAPLIGKEKVAYWFYQVSNLLLIFCLCFLKITDAPYWFIMGSVTYGLGIILCVAAVMNFAKPAENGINLNGLYRFSRNPMYVAYFIYFLGCVIITKSFILLTILLVFQISTHFIILSEERWCIKKFGEEYISYMKKVRRYI